MKCEATSHLRDASHLIRSPNSRSRRPTAAAVIRSVPLAPTLTSTVREYPRQEEKGRKESAAGRRSERDARGDMEIRDELKEGDTKESERWDSEGARNLEKRVRGRQEVRRWSE
ncbi:hypothetical protein GWK47_042732 [Chionoecetes opilio]|uniref:Uncharacterized protein n=1 Tax=Chionoecetes opilio TaxID=41210 RepID=A0A8J4Y8W5_CHIOP|nr:hypothetical protein GWK47_042732 [Chionoecetes opilio]